MILVGLFKRGQCEVRSIENPEWLCKIDEVIKNTNKIQ